MAGALLVTAVVVAVALAVRVVVVLRHRRREHEVEAELGSWTDPSARSRPMSLDLTLLEIPPPGPGKLLGVVFTHPDCGSCTPLSQRIAGIDDLVTAEVDVTGVPAAVRAAGVTSVPTLVLVGHDGAVVRSWIGAPLAGTVEETVRRTLDA